MVRVRLRVDPIKCKAHGMCDELIPERIRMDDWGYPIIDPRALPPDLSTSLGAPSLRAPARALSIDAVGEAGARAVPDDAD